MKFPESKALKEFEERAKRLNLPDPFPTKADDINAFYALQGLANVQDMTNQYAAYRMQQHASYYLRPSSPIPTHCGNLLGGLFS